MVRIIFDGVVEDYPVFSYYLSTSSTIVNNSHFESGVAKIMKKEYSTLTENEKNATVALKKECTRTDNVCNDFNNSLDELISRKRRRNSKEHEQYIDCSFLVATSNTVERLFSQCKYVLTDQRKSMPPIIFEAIIFLKMNRDFWDVAMLASAMKTETPKGIERDEDCYIGKQSFILVME